MFTTPGDGAFCAYLPGYRPDHVRSRVELADGRWHRLALQVGPDRLRLFVDGKAVAEQAVESIGAAPVPGSLAIGRLEDGTVGLVGAVGWVRIREGIRSPHAMADVPDADGSTVGLWSFPTEGDRPDRIDDASPLANPAVRVATRTALRPVLPALAVPAEPTSAFTAALVAEALERGDARRGAEVFAEPTVACVSCHRVGTQGGGVGPELTAVGKELTRRRRSSSRCSGPSGRSRRDTSPTSSPWPAARSSRATDARRPRRSCCSTTPPAGWTIGLTSRKLKSAVRPAA